MDFCCIPCKCVCQLTQYSCSCYRPRVPKALKPSSFLMLLLPSCSRLSSWLTSLHIATTGFIPSIQRAPIGVCVCVCVCVCVYAHANVSVRACALVRIHITCFITACPSFSCVLPFQVRRFNRHHFHRQRHNNSIRIQTAQCQAPSSSSSRTCDKTLQCSKGPQPTYHCDFICSGSRVQRLHHALHHRFVLPTRPLSCEDASRRAKSNTYKCV
jgi:hypothetical protein